MLTVLGNIRGQEPREPASGRHGKVEEEGEEGEEEEEEEEEEEDGVGRRQTNESGRETLRLV
jgi:hypothetical protein